MLYDDLQKIVSGILSDPNITQGALYLVEPNATVGAKPWKTVAGVPTRTLVNGAVRGVSKKYIDRSLAIETDLQAVIGVPAVPVTMSQYLEIDGTQYKIQHIENKPAAGTPVAIVLILRKGA